MERITYLCIGGLELYPHGNRSEYALFRKSSDKKFSLVEFESEPTPLGLEPSLEEEF